MSHQGELPAARDPSWATRLSGLVSSEIRGKHVLVVGCGSVGSFVAEELARAGVGRFTLVDPDLVEWSNLTRASYTFADVGAPKVVALKTRLQAIFPDIAVSDQQRELQALQSRLPSILGGVDLAIGAADDPRACGMLDWYCYHMGTPSVQIGLYKGALGGEVVAVLPGVTPCLGCATGGVRDAVDNYDSVTRNRDYGTTRLAGEVALGCDIHFVCSAGIKFALSLMTQDAPGASVGNFLRQPLSEGVHYLMMGTSPEYFLFAKTHAEVVGQHAYQSLWLKTTRRSDCPRCGEQDYREVPPFVSSAGNEAQPG